MRTKKLVRANRPETLPDGVYGNAWPNGTQGFDVDKVATPAPQVALPKNGSAVGNRKGNGGKRPGTGPKIDRRPFLCLFLNSCAHPGLGSPAGIDQHMRNAHGATMSKFLAMVTSCGFCGVSKSGSGLGLHMRQEHSDRIPRSQNGPVLAMVAILSREGDPQGSLTALREHVRNFTAAAAVASSAGTQLALEESPPADQPALVGAISGDDAE
jgi:hypothetical protein